jgi:uncharacterized lipoprotein YddW (UPF0748 family)
MTADRRDFLKLTGMGALAGLLPERAPAPPPRNWLWIPNTARRSADEWKREFARLRAAGIDAVLPEIYDGRNAFFASLRLPVKTDWLGQLLPIARDEGLELHAWMWALPCMIDAVMEAHPDWYNVNALGQSAVDQPAYVPYYRFLDPGRPEVREWVRDTVRELAAIPGLAGIHLDYIRHPDAILAKGLRAKYAIVQDQVYPRYDYGYSDYARGRFKAAFRADPRAGLDPALGRAWLQFRRDAVTDLVNDYLVPAARAGGKRITAAVLPGPSLARVNAMQDWGRWRLDGFMPMLYNNFYEEAPDWIAARTAEAVAAVRRPVYSGLFAGDLPDDGFARSIDLALGAGAAGVAVFADFMMTGAKFQILRRHATAPR